MGTLTADDSVPTTSSSSPASLEANFSTRVTSQEDWLAGLLGIVGCCGTRKPSRFHELHSEFHVPGRTSDYEDERVLGSRSMDYPKESSPAFTPPTEGLLARPPAEELGPLAKPILQSRPAPVVQIRASPPTPPPPTSTLPAPVPAPAPMPMSAPPSRRAPPQLDKDGLQAHPAKQPPPTEEPTPQRQSQRASHDWLLRRRPSRRTPTSQE